MSSYSRLNPPFAEEVAAKQAAFDETVSEEERVRDVLACCFAEIEAEFRFANERRCGDVRVIFEIEDKSA